MLKFYGLLISTWSMRKNSQQVDKIKEETTESDIQIGLEYVQFVWMGQENQNQAQKLSMLVSSGALLTNYLDFFHFFFSSIRQLVIFKNLGPTYEFWNISYQTTFGADDGISLLDHIKYLGIDNRE